MYSNTMNESKFLKKIQTKREEMIRLGNCYGLLDAKTIDCSQQLDSLLNEYYKCFQVTHTNQKFPLMIKEISFFLYKREDYAATEVNALAYQ
ncbi:aspartyl-phosphate phosphatase Spo0E family protein [Heyndrickxia acidicola]|uniref:Aspartyl-phosphate phosphatase Spo0E family protein n=1 Tax=Heyndrickxia acidicola TaxID=209389 RepID=A0ABU6MHX3_9BACI|nr:aspartyl-phosphate phosphatase Spo0E family protein [Heyndrickxia acidicola]MED1204282.1 aspartyl-phosphate phosphatase Spo0E family protein [Heyndrickxia acidicola]